MLPLHVIATIEIIYEYVFTLVTTISYVTNVEMYSHIISILRITSKISIRGQNGNGET